MKHYTHLTRDERCQIYALRKRKIKQEEIAQAVGVDQSTISRELARNKGKRGYRIKQAQAAGEQRRSAASSVSRVMTPRLIGVAESLLVGEQWSPEQIAGRLKLEGKTPVSAQSLYSHIWKNRKKGGHLYLHLRRRGKKRNKRSAKNAGRGVIPGRIDITERPRIVEAKTRLGDWELDSIVGAKHQGSITSMVERRSKLTRLVLQNGPTAQETKKAIITRLKPIAKHVHTLTSDNGKEFAQHAKIGKILEADFYFATPYHSWERGLNEHTNGLVRQYFPKGHDFATLRPSQVLIVEEKLNNRPRKILGYHSPNEVFAQLTATPNYALQI